LHNKRTINKIHHNKAIYLCKVFCINFGLCFVDLLWRCSPFTST